MHRFLAALALVAVMGPAWATEQETTLTRAEARAMPTEEITRRLFGGLAQIMFMRPYSDPTGPGAASMPLQSLSFLSRPRGTYRAGVCETDLVVVEFERALPEVVRIPAKTLSEQLGGKEVVPSLWGPDAPMRPRRFQVYTNYFVSDVALARQDRPAGEERWELDRSCAVLDPREAAIVVASSESQVVSAVQRVSDLIEAAAAGRPGAPLDCRDRSGATVTEAACLRDISRFRADRIYQTLLVEGCGRRDPEINCERVDLFGTFDAMEIMFEFRPGMPPSLVRIIVRPAFDESELIN